jgi:mannose-6-phosphate isomerase-like protein (cupin superfamily)
MPAPRVPRLEIEPDTIVVNRVTREYGRALERTEQRLVAELLVSPGGAVAGPHRPPQQTESFEVLGGVMGVRCGDERVELRAGESRTVPPGVVHDWWNAGDGVLHAMVTVSPPRNFVELIGALFGLAATGRTNAKGMPNPIDGALLMEAFGEDIVFERPPAPVRAVLIGVVAPLARRLGRSVTDEALMRAGIAPEATWPGAPA